LPEKWEEIKDIDIFFLSFDGPVHIHDLQRGNGSYEGLFRSMEFLKNKNKKFWTTTVITRHNFKNLDFILETAKEKRFITNFHLLYFSSNFAGHNYSIHPSALGGGLALNDKECREVIGYLLKRKETDMKDVIGSSALYFKNLIAWSDFSQVYREEKSKYYNCFAGRMFCYIDANADIYPCCDVMGIIKPRNILKDGFQQAFLSLPQPPCKSCLVACYLELNLMFSLRLGSIVNWAGKV
jgi:MoaA/NifB/PqqE/SkfB family radical SAM enzyme